MDSPLRVTFANFYMTNIENFVFENYPSLKPTIYCRFVDEFFLLINPEDQLLLLVETFKETSVLNFISEIEQNRQLNFLDVSINNQKPSLSTYVFTKPTNSGIYLDSKSERPERCKVSTVKALIHRTNKICTLENLERSINNLKQCFINNGYSNSLFDKIFNNYRASRGRSNADQHDPISETTKSVTAPQRTCCEDQRK